MTIIQTTDLTRRFGELTAVDTLNIEVARGEIFGLVGPDGAGKTTTLRLLCALMDPTSGQASVAGHDVAREPKASAPKKTGNAPRSSTSRMTSPPRSSINTARTPNPPQPRCARPRSIWRWSKRVRARNRSKPPAPR